ncbi:MAG: class II aldolase/adducin family protein [Verrucomicrobiota bacterium]
MDAVVPADSSLTELARAVGVESRRLVLPGEGSLAAAADAETFWMQAPHTDLVTLTASDFVRTQSQMLLPLLDNKTFGTPELNRCLVGARCDGADTPLSPDALIHACLLGNSGVAYSVHAHPDHVGQILCSPQARSFAQNHLTPEQVKHCGPAMLLIPAIERDLALALRVRNEVEYFHTRYGSAPRIILLENHGVYVLAGSAREALCTLLNLEKCARIFIGAAALGGPVFLEREQVDYLLKANGILPSAVKGSPPAPAQTPPAASPPQAA